MFDAQEELKKYKKIEIDNTFPTNTESSVNSIVAERLANDINKIAKSLFKLEQKYEDLSEEFMEAVDEKLEITEPYKSLVLSKDATLKELFIRIKDNENIIDRMVTAVIGLTDKLDIIYDFVSASKDSDWIIQMERILKSVELILASVGIHQTGNEKYFSDLLHMAVSTVEDEKRDNREVTGVERKGYIFTDRVMRKAEVIVNIFKK